MRSPTVKQKVCWTLMVIKQEIGMRKWKSVSRYFFDRKYRKDINRLRDMLAHGKLHSRPKVIRVGDISFSHGINYPAWVNRLEAQIMLGKELPPIKIIKHGDKYLVVDGNHRLMAMKRLMSADVEVTARELLRAS